MTTPPAAVAVTGLPMALGLALAGLATASAAITLAMSDPPPGLQGRNAAYNYYPQLALAAGVAELGAAAWWMADPPAAAPPLG